MKDDPKFNILFVKEVEKHPELYTSTVHGHVNKQEQEFHWKQVADALNESSANCKEKWKNLRSSLCRHLRNQYAFEPGMKCKKDYYLAQHMEFLIPYIKIRQPGQFTSAVDLIKEEECIEFGEYESDITSEMGMKEDIEPYSSTELHPTETIPDQHQTPESRDSPPLLALSPVQELHELPTVKKRRLGASPTYERMAKEYFILKSKVEAQPESADLLFLKSLLPEMQKMGDRQKNKFKMMILSAIDTVLYSSGTCDSSSSRPSTHYPASSGPSNHSVI